MFDYHMHTTVSFDGHCSAEQMICAAEKAGLKEICFTDHIDYEVGVAEQAMVFDTDAYNAAYDHVTSSSVKIRRGMEFGLKEYNRDQLTEDLKRRHFDFVLGSVHFVDELDVYFTPWWEGKTVLEAERRFLEQTLECVRHHDEYDVLAHLTYLSKTRAHPAPRLISYADHREILDEILRTLAAKGKGLELNTSGMDKCGGFIPTADYFRRFKELGGQIVTVGSDAHACDRVGQYSREACDLLGEIFGYVCTFADRKPIFHKI